jgi:hypothetical protein
MGCCLNMDDTKAVVPALVLFKGSAFSAIHSCFFIPPYQIAVYRLVVHETMCFDVGRKQVLLRFAGSIDSGASLFGFLGVFS